MRKSYVLNTVDAFTDEFARCCGEYDTLRIAVAWSGNPAHKLPYKLLENVGKKIWATVGTAFNQTHPETFTWFDSIGADIRVFRESATLFHPKVYLFLDGDRYAAFVGSSNLTRNGFYSNCEVNCLIEGTAPIPNDIVGIQNTLKAWHKEPFSFCTTTRWINGYRERYRRHPPPLKEDGSSPVSWLKDATWDVYYDVVRDGLEHRKQNGNGDGSGQEYHDVLDAARNNLPLPWTIGYLNDLENRRIIGGSSQYGPLGHVAASISFKSWLAGGPHDQWRVMVKAINAIAKFNSPLPLPRLKKHLEQLRSLGPTMYVWGRLLCIVHPDLYCTVSNVAVRKHLSELAGVPSSRFKEPEGYIGLIEKIHGSPWFNAKKPSDKAQAAIWKRRTAFLDAVLYS